MDTRFLQSLICVIETGSIAGAARVQNLTAAAVSQRIKALENALGCTLLLRSGHKVSPSDACLRIIPRLKHITAQVTLISGDLDITGLSGELKVGVISTLLSSLMPQCIKQLSQQAPNMLLQIIPGTSKELYQQLIEQKIDVALIVEPPFSSPKSLTQQFLLSQPLSFISREKHLNLHRAISTQPFIQYDHQAWGGAITKRYLSDNQLQVNALCEIDALETICLMVASNMGVSLVPMWQTMEQLTSNLHVTPILDVLYQRNISLLHHSATQKQQLVNSFKKNVIELSKA